MAATHVAYGGVDLTVPPSWRILRRAPAFCGSRLGQVLYVFNTMHSPPPGRSCHTRPRVGPYVSIECDPFNPQPQRGSVTVGATKADELGTTTTSGGLTDSALFLSGQDAVLEIYATPSLSRTIESSVATGHGHC